MTRRPHVLLIFMDDCTHWVLADPEVHTPHLDRLRERGVHFTHAHNQGSPLPAVCLPAREMLLSGRYLFHARGHLPEVSRLAPCLADGGYRTFFTGKWHNEPELLQTDYDEVGPNGRGMLDSVVTRSDADAYHRPRPDNHWDPTDTTLGGHWMALPDGRVQHSSERWADAAIGFLRDHVTAATDAGRDVPPFFAHIAFHAPHDPRQSPAEYLDSYDRDQIDVPPNFLPEHPFDNGALRIRDELLAPFPRTPDAVRLHRQEYFAILSHADAEIGRILETLDELSLAEETVVVFSGDHGLALGEHGLLGKQSCYDHSTRVPLVIAGPGIPAGEVRDALVYSGSIMPTLCDLVGIPVPASVEFASLAPTVHDNGAHLDELFGAYGEGESAQRWLRTTTHKVITYPPSGRVQLFDLEADPWERSDLSADPASQELLGDLLARLERAQHRYADPLVETGPAPAVTNAR